MRCAVWLGLLLVDVPAWAVELNAEIKGVVEDSDDLPVPNATVTLESPQLLGGATATTDPDGRYRFPSLPPGDYVVHVRAGSAFKDWDSGQLHVQLGQTANIDVTLVEANASEVVTVVSSAPTVDVERTSTGVTLDAKFLAHVPVPRSYQSAIAIAPGVKDDGSGNPNTQGGFYSANQFYVDGVNTTDPVTNTFSNNLNYDAIDSIQVITGGMDAEYGRALGGAFNIVTKSGGNEFSGSIVDTYSTEKMIVAPKLEGETRDPQLNEDLQLTLGGPIRRDKVWFFVSAGATATTSQTTVDPSIGRDLDKYPMLPQKYRGLSIYAKVTAQPTAEHNLSVIAESEPARIDNVVQDPYTLPSGEDVQTQGGWTFSLQHRYTPSQHVVVDNHVYWQEEYINSFPTAWEGCTDYDEDGYCKAFYDQPDPSKDMSTQHGWLGYAPGDFSAGAYPYATYENRHRISLDSATTLFFDALGEHQVKAGVQADYVLSKQVYPGQDFYYYTHTGDDPNDLTSYVPVEWDHYSNNDRATLGGVEASVYVQDVWKPVDRLTIRPGLRLDHPALYNDVHEVVVTSTTLSPRFGLAYDLTGDKKTSVHAYYGRFHDIGFLAVASILNKRSSSTSTYFWDDKSDDWSTTPSSSTSASTLTGDLHTPYSNQFNVGLTRQVGDTWSVDATWIYKSSGRFWEDDDVNLIWNSEGSDVIGYRNGVNESIWRLRTADDTWTKYTSVEVQVAKQMTDDFGLLGSYTWSHAVGTNSADQATSVHDIPEQRQYETGLLDYDIPHDLKLTGTYSKADVATIGKLAVGYDLGWSFAAESGAIYRPVVWNDYYQGYYNYASESDGRYRLPMYASTDLQADIAFSVGDGGSVWSIGANVYNVFDDRTLTAVSTEYGPDGDGNDPGTFGTPLGYQGPRNFELIFRGDF